MTYAQHLSALIEALFEAVPGLSQRRLSERAGLNPGWVADFRRTGKATLDNAERIVAAARALCPTGEDGDKVRALLAMLPPPQAEVAA